MCAIAITGRIEILERLVSSRNGNPRFSITLVSESNDFIGTWNTAADHSFNYDIGNPGFRTGSTVTITVGGRGTITDIDAK